jgi:leader peptidase (prepilin peptidase)/N-methyltransferase
LSPRYPIVELLGGVLAVAVTQQVFINVEPTTPILDACLLALCYYAFAGGLLIATFVDLEHMEIPDEVSLPGTALGLLTASYRNPPGAADAALGAGAGFLFIQVLFVWGYERMTGRRGMGEGDSKLLMMIGAFLGWEGAVFALVAAAVQGVVVAVVALARGWGSAEIKDAKSAEAADENRETENRPLSEADADEEDPPPTRLGHLKLPFGPFLALGALEYFFFGDHLIDYWMRFAGGLAGVLGIGG